MLFRIKQNRRIRLGQSTAEYATLLVIIIGAITVMQLFLKRGHQGWLAGFAHHLTGNEPKQFEPYYSESSKMANSAQAVNQELISGGEFEYAAQSSQFISVGQENTLGVVNDPTQWGWNIETP